MVNSPNMFGSAGPAHCGYSVASKVFDGQKGWQDYRNFLCIALLFTYLVFIPGGILGFYIAVACLIIKLTTTPNIESIGIYMLLFGMKTFGMVTLVFGYPSIGGKVAFVIGFAILVLFTDFRKTLYSLRTPFLYFVWIALVLYLFYLSGPQTEYCTGKLIDTIIFGIVLLILYYYLINSRSVDWFHIGQLGVLSALVCLSACILVSPYVKPDSVLDVGAMRLAYAMDKNIFQIRNVLGGMALLGFVLLYASSADRFLSRLSLVDFCIYLVSALFILNWGGARLPLVTAIVVVVTIFLARPLYRKRYGLLTGLVIGLSILVLAYGLSQQYRFITGVMDPSRSFTSRVNRDTNWEAGYRRFIEKPIFGHGLGGYYIEGYSYPGSGTYAHNLGLELLSETGVVGILLILAPLLLWRNTIRRVSFLTRTQNGSAVFPLLLMLFLQAMISFDLPANIGLFSMIGAIAVSPNSPKTNHRWGKFTCKR